MHPSPAPLALPVLLLLVAGSESEEPAPPAADPAIQGEVLQRHVEVLASDAMEGRLAGSESTRRASAYLAAALEGAGLEPGGWTGSAPSEDGESTWFQQVPLVRQEFDRDPVLTLVDQAGEESSIAYGVEFLLSPAGPDRVRGPYDVVHVRSADDLPEECGPGTALLFHTGRSDQRRLLEEAGHPDGVGLGLVLRAAGSRPGRPTRRPRGGRLRLSDGEAERAPGITLRGPASDAADSWARVTLDPGGGDVPAPDRNVVGIIRGRGTPDRPELADEVVVLSAHFDHIGIGGPEDAEDRIRNGADDDASGVAVLLELAEALAAEPPVRTVVVLLATAEEQGILGTRWFVREFPLTSVVCNLNFEMLGRPDPEVGGAGRLWLTGYERSNLGELISAAGTGVVADPRLEQNFFQRSDNIVFVQEGIVGQTLSTYNMHRDYHQVTDEADTLDYEHMEAAARACLVAVRAVVDGADSPAWKPGEPNLGR